MALPAEQRLAFNVGRHLCDGDVPECGDIQLDDEARRDRGRGCAYEWHEGVLGQVFLNGMR